MLWVTPFSHILQLKNTLKFSWWLSWKSLQHLQSVKSLGPLNLAKEAEDYLEQKIDIYSPKLRAKFEKNVYFLSVYSLVSVGDYIFKIFIHYICVYICIEYYLPLGRSPRLAHICFCFPFSYPVYFWPALKKNYKCHEGIWLKRIVYLLTIPIPLLNTSPIFFYLIKINHTT